MKLSDLLREMGMASDSIKIPLKRAKILKALTPISDQDIISPYRYNIKQISDKEKKNVNYGIVSRSNTKFSKLTSKELYGRQ